MSSGPELIALTDRKAKMPTERARRRKVKLTDRLPLPGGLSVSPVCLGWVERPSVIGDGYDAGINFFFLTADMHWPLYESTRRGLRALLRRGRSVRAKIVVGVVSYVAQPVFSHVPFREVLDALPELERIDISIVGGVYAGDLLPRLGEYRKHRLPDGGPFNIPGVKATGATFHDRKAALVAMNHRLVDVAFCRYNANHPGAEADLFPHLSRPPRPLLFSFNTTHGHVDKARLKELGLPREAWRPTVADHYRFGLRQRAIDGLLCALRSSREIDELAAALAAGGVTDEEAAYMRGLADLDAGRPPRG